MGMIIDVSYNVFMGLVELWMLLMNCGYSYGCMQYCIYQRGIFVDVVNKVWQSCGCKQFCIYRIGIFVNVSQIVFFDKYSYE